LSLEQIADKVVETDVLVVGGGIAGCPAAAKAAEHGLKVTLIEKSKTDRSGSAGQGIDHYGSFPRGGLTVLALEKQWDEMGMANAGGTGLWVDPNISYRIFDNHFWALEELEKLGATMKWDDGEYYWAPHLVRGIKNGLRVHWQNVKPELTAAMKERGVNVINRTMIVDLLTNNGAVTGATAVNTRTGDFIVIKAKAVIMATGNFARCYNPETPLFWKYKFNYHWCPATCAGDGFAAAYRGGAELVNMEIAGWGHRIRDDKTISMGNFMVGDGIPCKTLTWTGDEVITGGPQKTAELEQEGLDPIYLSLEHLPDDYHKRMEIAYADERMVSFKVAEDRGFNPRTHWYHSMPNAPHQFDLIPGVFIDEDFKASTLKGLYAVGTVGAALGGCHGAAVSGLLIGDSISNFVSGVADPAVDEAQVENQKQTALAPMSVKDGTEPVELECAIRYICERYVGMFRSEGKLREGLRRLGSLRRVFLPRLMAQNPHHLMRCLEVRNILDLADVHIQACLDRRETRGCHIRLDHPAEDPSRDNMLTFQRIEDGKPVLEIRKIPGLKPEYAKEG